jgi:Fur family peroxide stress response transcriptional regulator
MPGESTFRELCHERGLAATHQRQVIYETVMALRDHPSPELIYEKALRRIPSISLATVYKNLHIFLDRGMLQEVGLHQGSIRIETNRKPHHHLVCTNCKKIWDLHEAALQPLQLNKKSLQGFKVKRISIDVLGLCGDCATAQS